MGYYASKLSGERLRACYGVASPRVQAYLEAEVAFIERRIPPAARILELGCGYGRVIARLASRAQRAVGIDSAPGSLALAQELFPAQPRLAWALMDAGHLGFPNGSFDLTLCIQNGISAFKLEPPALAREALRVTRPGGVALFSTYAARFWPHRLEWFEAQSGQGLLGPIDYEATGDGVIVCRDGFRATTFSPDQFAALAATVGAEAELEEVDGSSLFCTLRAR